MRKVITGAFVSLDGVMQAPGGPQEDPTGGFAHGGWVAPYADETFGEEIGALFGQSFDLLLGRKTYEIFAAHWPYAVADEDAAIAKPFNAATKYVATRSDMKLSWERSVRLTDGAAEVARLKQEDGPALVTQGSCDFLQTLLAHDLVDEIRLFTFPVVLGGGKKLFGSGARAAAFETISAKVSTKGVTITSLRRAGAVQTGDFTIHPPSPAETARRAKWAREG